MIQLFGYEGVNKSRWTYGEGAFERLPFKGPLNDEYEEIAVAPIEGSLSAIHSTVPVEEPTEPVSLVTLARPRLSRSVAFLQLQEQMEEAPLMARHTVSAERLEDRDGAAAGQRLTPSSTSQLGHNGELPQATA
uniref:Uncharacterized protein n=1 Tax=Sphaerodactylus townsendi TaxID=933632 RepID=A0ACB8E7W7_9SAUR